jgi:hypothetical protein
MTRGREIQYLGVPGCTAECVQAMVTILTSPFPCREVTVLFCPKHPDDEHYAVSFVVWDWLGSDVPVVPDGFGTHDDTGGWGLEVVLELILFYQVPLKEKWIKNVEQFERINRGRPTERDLRALHESDHQAPSWQLHVGTFGPHLWSHALTGEPETFPYGLLEPELLEDVQGAERDPASAVFRATKRLEVVIRDAAGLDAHLVGLDVVNEAMRDGNQTRGPGLLIPKGATASEVQAWTNLFRGAIGALRNPVVHRDVKLTVKSASTMILTVSMLLRKLKADYPEKFVKEEVEEEDSETEEKEAQRLRAEKLESMKRRIEAIERYRRRLAQPL